MHALLVEGSPRSSSLIRGALVRAGWSVDVLGRGEEVVHLLREFPYDVAVIDVATPGLDGRSILERLRSELNAVPILLLTGRKIASKSVEDEWRGVNECLPKPFTADELVARVGAMKSRTGNLGHSCVAVAGELPRVGRPRKSMAQRRLMRSVHRAWAP